MERQLLHYEKKNTCKIRLKKKLHIPKLGARVPNLGSE